VTFSRSIRSSASAASNLYIVTSSPAVAVMTQMPVTPAMWKNGNVHSATVRAGAAGAASVGGLSSGGVAITIWSAPLKMVLVMFVTWLRCEPTAPFGNPVVPDV
jgi:hypothetical protein